MTWAPAQAGNRASKTRPYLRWWDSKSEQDVVTSATQHIGHSTFYYSLLLSGSQGGGCVDTAVPMRREPAARRRCGGSTLATYARGLRLQISLGRLLIPTWVRMAAQGTKSTSMPHAAPGPVSRPAWKRAQSIHRTTNVGRKEKADSTLRSSQAVPHPSTNRALRRLTSEVRRDPVHSTRYGRQRGSCTATLQRRPSAQQGGPRATRRETPSTSAFVGEARAHYVPKAPPIYDVGGSPLSPPGS